MTERLFRGAFPPLPTLESKRGLPLGERFGSRFHLLEELAGGVMGHAYVAFDEQTRSSVTLKIIDPGRIAKSSNSRRRALALLEREVEVFARMSHPNVLPVLACGRVGELFVIATPAISGLQLSESFSRLVVFSLKGVLRIVGDVAQALSALHAAGLIHRDVRPSNIILTYDQHALLADFGFSLAGGGHAGLGSRRERVVWDLMPEALVSEEYTSATDVYALGLLFGGLLRRVPASPGEAEKGMRMEFLTFGRVGIVSPGQLPGARKNIPSVIEEMLAHMLDPDPAERPGAELVARVLGGLVDLTVERGGEGRGGWRGGVMWPGSEGMGSWGPESPATLLQALEATPPVSEEAITMLEEAIASGKPPMQWTGGQGGGPGPSGTAG